MNHGEPEIETMMRDGSQNTGSGPVWDVAQQITDLQAQIAALKDDQANIIREIDLIKAHLAKQEQRGA